MTDPPLHFCEVCRHQGVHIDWTVLIEVTVQDNIAKATELRSSQRLGKKIPYHFICWAVFHGNVPALDHVGDEEISDVHVSGSFAAGGAAVCFEQHCALIVLMDHAWLERISLLLEEISGPEDGRHILMHRHDLCFC